MIPHDDSEFFLRPTLMTKQKNIYFFIELKTYHLSYSTLTLLQGIWVMKANKKKKRKNKQTKTIDQYRMFCQREVERPELQTKTKEMKTHMTKNDLQFEHHDHLPPFSFYCMATGIKPNIDYHNI